MKNINISLPKNIEEWIKEECIINDDEDLEFAIVSLLAKEMFMEDMKKRYGGYGENEESEQ